MQQHVPWLIAGRYEVGDVVGRGGYGMVYRGLDCQTGQRVALKMLSPEAGRDADVVERMLREQQALVALSGTCAVTAIDLCRLDSSAPCLVMEWLEGGDLEQQLGAWEGAGERGSIELLLAILGPLTQTLERAHGIGIVHRDIKPANIFLTPGMAPGVRLLDFGLSRMKSAAPLTAVGMVMGSPSYIAPETWRGNSAALDGRADLFALAVIVFRWLTGTLPFDAHDLIGKMTAVTSGPRPSIAPQRADLPASVDAWMTRALAIEPSDRFQTGGELFRAFEAALRGESWPQASADTSGVRSAATAGAPLDTSERKSALAGAWRAAASLLKRFTGARRRESPLPTPPAEPAPAPVAAAASVTHDAPTAEPWARDRQTIWLDSTELRDAEPETKTSPEPAPKPTPEPRLESAKKPRSQAPKPAKKATPKPKAKAQSKTRTRAKTKPQSKSRARAKTATQSKPKARKPKARSR